MAAMDRRCIDAACYSRRVPEPSDGGNPQARDARWCLARDGQLGPEATQQASATISNQTVLAVFAGLAFSSILVVCAIVNLLAAHSRTALDSLDRYSWVVLAGVCAWIVWSLVGLSTDLNSFLRFADSWDCAVSGPRGDALSRRCRVGMAARRTTRTVDPHRWSSCLRWSPWSCSWRLSAVKFVLSPPTAMCVPQRVCCSLRVLHGPCHWRPPRRQLRPRPKSFFETRLSDRGGLCAHRDERPALSSRCTP